ncbi:hypothetical protein BgAZ_400770 [Babesia gibsoni]|uniref:Uncharacterized protein n=1 Tax=Babesia gibsoni TaxID=33632 RepID=A0AAD8LPL6_BABGI|nr:hypothetical protein BgAZ_400770 [Babesia gibsoni]
MMECIYATAKKRSNTSKSKSLIPKKKAKEKPTFNKAKMTITAEQRKKIDELYRAHIAVTDTPAYVEKLSLNTYTEESSPYLTLFQSEKITKDDLIGIDQPFGLVPPDRYELWKLCGRVCDPEPPISSQSLTPKQFTQRLFGNKFELTKDEFNYNIDYKMRFYAPGYGDIFFIDKVRCWRAWFLFRDYKEGREDLPTYRSIHQILRPKDEFPLSAAMLAVNYEIHRQGVHPAILDMFWKFFTDDEEIIKRDIVTCKLNWIVDRLKKLDPGEGISPDNFYHIFIEPAREALKHFHKDSFVRDQHRRMRESDIYQKVLSNNKALRQRYKILTAAYLEEIRSMYKTPTPTFYRRYERRRLAGYFNLLADNYERNQRRRALPPELVEKYKAERAAKPVVKKKREKRPSKRNKKLGRGVAN